MARGEDEIDPGAGSASRCNHLAETVKAGWNGAHDALDNAPTAHATVPSQTEQDVLARVGELQASIRRETSARLNALYAEVIGAREAFTTERYEARIRSLDETMRALLTKGGGALKQKVHDACAPSANTTSSAMSTNARPIPAGEMAVHAALPDRAAGDREPLERHLLRRGERVRPRRGSGDSRHHLGAQYRVGVHPRARTGALYAA